MPAPSSGAGLPLATRDASPRRGRHHPGPLPLLFVVLVVVAASSFFHSVSELPHSTSNNHLVGRLQSSRGILHASLQEFKQQQQQQQQQQQPGWRAAGTVAKKGAVPPEKEAGDDDTTWIDKVKEDPIANPPLSNGTDTFSACLLVMVRCGFWNVVDNKVTLLPFQFQFQFQFLFLPTLSFILYLGRQSSFSRMDGLSLSCFASSILDYCGRSS